MNSVIDNIRARHKLSDSTPLGVAGIFGKEMTTDTENRQVWCIANSDDVDLTREVVVPSGADISYFKANGNIFVDHKTTMDSWVGKMRDMRPSPDARMFKAWRVGVWLRKTELGDDILTMASEGGIGWSIGFIPTEHGKPTSEETKMYSGDGNECEYVIRRWKWLELSATPFPCNVNCQTQAVTRSAGAPDVIETLLSAGRIKKASAAAVGYPVRTGPSIRVKWVAKNTPRP